MLLVGDVTKGGPLNLPSLSLVGPIFSLLATSQETCGILFTIFTECGGASSVDTSGSWIWGMDDERDEGGRETTGEKCKLKLQLVTGP